MARSCTSNGTADQCAYCGFEAKFWLSAEGLIYDPAGSSGAMFVQSELPSEATVCQFVESQGGQLRDISIYTLSFAA